MKDEEEEDSDDDVVIENTIDVLSIRDLVRLLAKHGLIPGIRILMSWLTTEDNHFDLRDPSLSSLMDKIHDLFLILDLDHPSYGYQSDIDRELCLDEGPTSGLLSFRDWVYFRGICDYDEYRITKNEDSETMKVKF